MHVFLIMFIFFYLFENYYHDLCDKIEIYSLKIVFCQ